MSMSVQALVLAAGKGTRMRSGKPKMLHALLGLPLLEHVLRAVDGVGADPVHVVVGHQAAVISAEFPSRSFIRQEPPLGTGHAVQIARQAIAQYPDRPLLVVYGDVPLLSSRSLRTVLAAHAASGASATLLSADLAEPGAYGRVARGPDGDVVAIVEAKDASPAERSIREINTGTYVFAVPPLLSVLDGLAPDNSQREYYLTDVVGMLSRAGLRVTAQKIDDPAEALGVNSLAELAEIERLLRLRIAAAFMEAGVRIEDPASTFIGLDVTLEPDATIRPGCILEGKTRVETGAVVGPYARLQDAEIRQGAQILDHCLLRECIVETGASVGPFAHIRPQSRIRSKAKVGNFVELKKTDLGEGSKAPHLSYLGDATIGPSVNIGAGTITCNYDGREKHPTRIAAGAFIGSDTTLVAPLTIGEGAYIGAGSTITKDVPPNALALGRARQVVKEDWAEARRRTVSEEPSDAP
jgi:bifunctional UDP-N-acetylglucosamine pyrophosphorylase / glucosamine-1-phosphate N-acetyltransferase